MISFHRGFKATYVAAIVVLIGGALGFRGAISSLQVHLMKKAVPLRLSLDSLPEKLGDWEKFGDDAEFGAAEIESLGTDIVLTRRYRQHGTGEMIELHVAYYTGKIDSVPHVPERCWASSGLLQTVPPVRLGLDVGEAWVLDEEVVHASSNQPYPIIHRTHPVTRRPEKVFMPMGAPEIRVTEFQDAKRPDNRLVGGYFFIANGQLTPSAFGVRGLAFSRSNEYAYYCKVQLNYVGTVGNSDELVSTFIPIASAFVDALLPELMTRLPEWPSIEGGPSGTLDRS